MCEEARYVYSIVNCSGREDLGRIGVGDGVVYTIPLRDISAVVHSCRPVPYHTEDAQAAEEWVLEHSYVIDQATKRFGTVLPFAFDVVIRGDDHVIVEWLSRNYEGLKAELERVSGRSEYSIQIFYDYDRLANRFLSEDKEIMKLKEKIAKMRKGTAYLFQKNMDLKVKEKVASEVSRLSEEFGVRIKSLADELKVEKSGRSLPEKYRDLKPMISLYCLVRDDKITTLGEVLEEINNLEGFAVRFTGPWAPFSFVNISETQSEAQ